MDMHASSRGQSHKRAVSPCSTRLLLLSLISALATSRLDAVDDLNAHPEIEASFMSLVKGLPDLERIISRIHAGSCKVKDFLKVLEVRITILRNCGLRLMASTVLQASEQRHHHNVKRG